MSMQTVKHCGVRVFGCFAASGTRQLVINSVLYKNILKEDSSSFPEVQKYLYSRKKVGNTPGNLKKQKQRINK